MGGMVLADVFRPVMLDDINQIVYFSDAHSLGSCSLVVLNYPDSHHLDSEGKVIEEKEIV